MLGRVLRFLARFVFAISVGTAATVLGTVLALLGTEAGRALVARGLTDALRPVLRGTVTVGRVSGSFLLGIRLERVRVVDTAGVLLADLPLVEADYQLPQLLAGRVVLRRLAIERPVLNLVKHRGGRMNYEEVLRLGEGKGRGPSPLIEFRNLRVTGGHVLLHLPYTAPGHLATAAQRDSALAAQRAAPGRVLVDGGPGQGLERLVLFSGLSARIPRLTLSTPDHRPTSLRVDTLALAISDPAMTLLDFRGDIALPSDSAVFRVERAALPRTVVTGGGAVTWPRDTILYDFRFEAREAALADLRWVAPAFPDLAGSATLEAKWESGTRTAYRVSGLRLAGQGARVEGTLTALTDTYAGLGLRNADLRLDQLDLDLVRGFLDTLPFFGKLSGRLQADGFFPAMRVRLDWRFDDARVPGGATNYLAGAGTVALGGVAGLAFGPLVLDTADVDLRTARLLVPAVILDGRVAGHGALAGPLDQVTFTGRITHRDGDLPASTVDGHIAFDTRAETARVNGELTLDPLRFDGIRPAFPAIGSRGELRGLVRLDGPVDRLFVDADVRGELGEVRGAGTLTMLPPRWVADSLRLAFRDLDLAALTGVGPATRLAGTLAVDGSVDTLVAPAGTLDLALGRSSVAEVRLDTAWVRMAIRDSLLTVDTAGARWLGGEAAASGTLGWTAPHRGRVGFAAQADNLLAFDSLMVALTGTVRDTLVAPFDGVASLTATLAGSLDSLEAEVEGTARRVAWQGNRLEGLVAQARWLGGRRPRVTASLFTDTLALGTVRLSRARFDLAGFADSLAWLGELVALDSARLATGGSWRTDGPARLAAMDSLDIRVGPSHWFLRQPAGARIDGQLVALEPFELVKEDGSGRVTVAGVVPSPLGGYLSVGAFGLGLRDLYALLQRDTSGVGGTLGLDLSVGGTLAAPSIRGTASVADARFGDFRSPFLRASMDYDERRLRTGIALWRTGRPVLNVDARLPLDLALARVPRRQLDGPIEVHATADSVDFALVSAYTTNVRDASGLLAVDVHVGGTWDHPELSGFVAVRDAAMTIPGLGVRYTEANARATLAGDSVTVERFEARSGLGRLELAGVARVARLTAPTLDLRARLDQFRLIDARDFLTADGTGDVTLTGPLLQPTLRGRLTANTVSLYFADLITKQVVDLEDPDPANADLVDLEELRRRKLTADFSSRFLDSLRVEDLEVRMGDQVWLRSSEANIQLGGSVRVEKLRRTYRVDGALDARRGSYKLAIGPVVRDFTVERGTVRYYGTPDLNADLDIEARHVVRSTDGSGDIPVIARIGGSLLLPSLALSSTVRPEPSQSDLVSYLMFGRPQFSVGNSGGQGGGQSAALATGLEYVSSALSGEVQRALVSNLGVPIDYLLIRPGIAGLTQVSAGWQVGRQWFVAFSAGVCTGAVFTPRNIGASIEYRFRPRWRAQLVTEPVQSCSVTNPLVVTTRYQFGTDVLWEREW